MFVRKIFDLKNRRLMSLRHSEKNVVGKIYVDTSPPPHPPPIITSSLRPCTEPIAIYLLHRYKNNPLLLRRCCQENCHVTDRHTILNPELALTKKLQFVCFVRLNLSCNAPLFYSMKGRLPHTQALAAS